jgi:glycine cleavage system H protein
VDISAGSETLAKGETFGAVEAVKTVSDLFMPVSGVVVERNEALNAEPELVNKDPYGAGWMVKVKLSDAAELNALMSAAEYEQSVA